MPFSIDPSGEIILRRRARNGPAYLSKLVEGESTCFGIRTKGADRRGSPGALAPRPRMGKDALKDFMSDALAQVAFGISRENTIKILQFVVQDIQACLGDEGHGVHQDLKWISPFWYREV